MATSKELAQANIKTLSELIKKRGASLASVAAENIKPERLTRLVLAVVSRTPALAQCTPESVYRALMQAAELGLEPGSAIGEAYLVPYKTECQLIPGYRGLISLAFRSGLVKSVAAKTVHDGDTFEYEEGLNPVLRHVPDLAVERDGKNMTHAYCVIHLLSGGVVYDVMTKRDIERIRNLSAGKNAGPWSQHYLEMARKTVVRRAIKYAPMSIQMARALAVDDHHSGIKNDDGAPDAYMAEFEDLAVDPDTGEILVPDQESKSDRIANLLGEEPGE